MMFAPSDHDDKLSSFPLLLSSGLQALWSWRQREMW